MNITLSELILTLSFIALLSYAYKRRKEPAFDDMSFLPTKHLPIRVVIIVVLLLIILKLLSLGDEIVIYP